MHGLLFLAIFSARIVALPATSAHVTQYDKNTVSQSLYARQDKHGAHGGANPGEAMSGGDMGGMGGSMGGSMGGGLVDSLQSSSFAQPLLNIAVPYFPTMSMVKKVEQAPTTKKQGAKRSELWFGPFDVATVAEKKKNPNRNIIGMDPQGTSFITQATEFPKDITILNAFMKLRYEDGKLANVGNGIYNHHVVFADTNKAPPALVACPKAKPKAGIPVSVFVGAGADGITYDYTTGGIDSGYYIGKQDSIFLTAELVNYTNDTKKIYAVVEMEYTPGKSKLDVSAETLGVGQCEGALTVRPKDGQTKFSLTSKEMTVQMDGYIFGVRGHLHDGGVSIPLSINNKTVCVSEAKYGGAGSESGQWATIGSMTQCDDVIPVKKGDVLTVSAKYDIDLHPQRAHAGGGTAEEMGLVLFRFAPTGPTSQFSSSSPTESLFTLGTTLSSSLVTGSLDMTTSLLGQLSTMFKAWV